MLDFAVKLLVRFVAQYELSDLGPAVGVSNQVGTFFNFLCRVRLDLMLEFQRVYKLKVGYPAAQPYFKQEKLCISLYYEGVFPYFCTLDGPRFYKFCQSPCLRHNCSTISFFNEETELVLRNHQIVLLAIIVTQWYHLSGFYRQLPRCIRVPENPLVCVVDGLVLFIDLKNVGSGPSPNGFDL